MDAQSWEREVENALRLCGVEYRPTYSDIALVSPRPTASKSLAADMKIAMEREFWRRACAHQLFGDTNRVAQRFGRSIEDNYGVREGPFLDLARTYWTFKIEVQDIFPHHHDTWIGQALIAVEYDVAVLYFPTPGPMSISKKQRKKAQREHLQAAAPSFEIERFLKENPMLKGWFG